MAANERLILDEEEIQLGEETVVALTLQVNNIASLESRQGNHSNQFRVPFTQQNHLALGFANQVGSSTEKPYRKLPAKYISSGVFLIPDGYAIVEQASDAYKVAVYSGNSDFFDAIEGRKLRDLTGFAQFNHEWSIANVYNSRLNSDYYIYPLIDYGRMPDAGRTFLSYELFPAFFVKDIIQMIVEEAGWIVTGDILTDDTYVNLLLAWAEDKWEHSADYTEGLSDSTTGAQVSPFQQENHPGGAYQYYTVELEDSAHIVGNAYVAPTDLKCKLSASLEINYTTTGNGSGFAYAEFFHVPSGQVLHSEFLGNVLGNSTNSVLSIEAMSVDNISLDVGQDVILRIKYHHASPSWFNVNDVVFVVEAKRDIVANAMYELTNQLPDMDQKEFMKWVMNMFAISPESQSWNKTLNFRSFQELTDNIPNAKDMSSKMAAGKPLIEYRMGDYAQNNQFTYQHDEGVSPETGNGSFPIDDTTLAANKVVVGMPFGASDMVQRLHFNTFSLYFPLIDKIDDVTGLVSKNTAKRFVVLRRGDIPSTIRYSDIATTISEDEDLPFCHFNLPGQDTNIDWESLLDRYYTAIINSVSRTKKVTTEFNLTVQDIQNFDHFIPWYINQFSAYFYVNVVKNFKKGKPTVVELIRI